MNAPASIRNKPRTILRSLLGFSNAAKSGEMTYGADEHPSDRRVRPDPAHDARKDVLERISGVILSNHLELSKANLLTLHGAFSGSEFKLASEITARQVAGLEISQEWLDSHSPDACVDEESERSQLDSLTSRLETSVDKFRETTRSARTATSNYSSELEEHVAMVEDGETTERLLANLTDITRAMLERTQKIEMQMKRSEKEAQSLRKSLLQARRNAEIDHLTDLPNRRAFEGFLEREFQVAQSLTEPLSVAFCDIDNFKRINDTHGHETGDRVIRIVADVLRKITSETCHVARHGGEEFVMLFRGMDTAEARDLLDRTRIDLSERRFRSRATDAFIGNITFSGGVAAVLTYATPRDALRAADEAMYRAKASGRNRIEVA